MQNATVEFSVFDETPRGGDWGATQLGCGWVCATQALKFKLCLGRELYENDTSLKESNSIVRVQKILTSLKQTKTISNGKNHSAM